MKKIFNKKILYILLGASLNLIDFSRNDLSSNVYSVAIGLIGLVVFALILTHDGLKKYFGPEAVCLTVIYSLAGCVMIKTMKESLIPTVMNQGLLVVFNCWWMSIVGIGRAKDYIAKKSEQSSKKKVCLLYILWTAASLWALIGRSDIIWPVWFFAMFTLFYTTVYTKEDWREMWDKTIVGFVWTFVILGLVFLPLRPITDVRYIGYYTNANDFACFLAVTFVLCLAKINMIRTKNKKIPAMVAYGVVAAVVLNVSFLTGCRTVWIIEIVETLFFFIAVIGNAWLKKAWKTIVVLLVSAGVVVLLFFPTFFAVRYIPALCPYSIHFWDENRDDGFLSETYSEEESYVELDEVLSVNFERFFEMIGGVFNNSPLAITAKAQETAVVSNTDIAGLPTSISVRYNLAKAYLPKINLFGHRRGDIHFVGENGENVWHSQNYWIEMSYWFGAPFALLMLCVFVLAFLRSIKALKKEDDAGLNILPFMVIVMYFIYGLMEVTWLPGYIILTIVYLVQHPQFFENEKTSEKADSDVEKQVEN